MKSKKFVLAALALLAITGLLALAGCKNDSVPETRKYTVTFNTDGGSTVASQTVESGQKATRPAADPTLEGSWFLGWYSDEGLAKKFDFNTPITTATTVYAKWSYKLHTEPSILTNYTSPNHTDSKWKYVEFGDWPQTILKGDVKVDESKSKEMGMFTYYLGDDDNYYVKHSDKYYKVEPIVWRVLTEDYKAPDGNSTSNALLLAESILTGGIRYYDVYNVDRTVGEATIHPNNYEHSTVRAWLNGLKYLYKKTDGQVVKEDYFGKGFLQTAFTESAQDLIELTSVDNSAASTFGTGEITGDNPYASDTPTRDKIFLLSEEEATNSEYGFDEYDRYVGDDYNTTTSTRIRVTTDYAGATLGSSSAGFGGYWWLRSPFRFLGSIARNIDFYGAADDFGDFDVNYSYGGVVPALSISLQSNLSLTEN